MSRIPPKAVVEMLIFDASTKGRNRLPFQPVDATLALPASAGVFTPPVRGQRVIIRTIESSSYPRPAEISAPACFQRVDKSVFYPAAKPLQVAKILSVHTMFRRFFSKCCVDLLRSQPKADIRTESKWVVLNVCFGEKSRHWALRVGSYYADFT